MFLLVDLGGVLTIFLCYPMLENPDDEVVKELILADYGTTHLDMLRRIIHSWGKGAH